jgi:ABC-type Na+ efflux pump permease subunit
MNREAVPLVIGIFFPIIFVALIILSLSRMYKFTDLIAHLKNLNIIYYIVFIPFMLGFFVIIFWFRKPKGR